jgi:hypothetical protein
MFYVISASNPNSDDASGLINQVKNTVPLFTEGRPDKGDITELAIDKTQFKIGSLDQLMILNETAQKLDA